MLSPEAERRTRKLLGDAITICGSEQKLGRAAGYSQNAIWQAKRRGTVTAEMATGIEAATRGQVTRVDLRPDLFGDEGRGR